MSAPTTETLSVIVERELPHPPEKIWRALTRPHLIEEWLMKNDFKPVVGHRFNVRRNPKPDLNIVVDCEVLVIEPNRTLSYTWSAFNIDGVVTWTLTPTDSGTHLRVEQSGFRPDQKKAHGGARGGWRQVFGKLEQVLAQMD
jgi:uncharacterized protein YndB with AHSA1/START domain